MSGVDVASAGDMLLRTARRLAKELQALSTSDSKQAEALLQGMWSAHFREHTRLTQAAGEAGVINHGIDSHAAMLAATAGDVGALVLSAYFYKLGDWDGMVAYLDELAAEKGRGG